MAINAKGRFDCCVEGNYSRCPPRSTTRYFMEDHARNLSTELSEVILLRNKKFFLLLLRFAESS